MKVKQFLILDENDNERLKKSILIQIAIADYKITKQSDSPVNRSLGWDPKKPVMIVKNSFFLFRLISFCLVFIMKPMVFLTFLSPFWI